MPEDVIKPRQAHHKTALGPNDPQVDKGTLRTSLAMLPFGVPPPAELFEQFRQMGEFVHVQRHDEIDVSRVTPISPRNTIIAKAPITATSAWS